ncbi:DEAD/DEAH box helicase [Ligilactobacillus acidipiscis]|uniref:DEAD/DEAH box helicase domain protein n=1 Tax=Ligilactobacillus acidipiscis TaxID=89059 RepID=A0A1K1KQA8_9LACO|nr:DEAD/DEAH box helicase [Ligilactobacillus acidipiscis]SFV41061.1 DEAD/DEAH box helicase domain protein [Ligilactobacillus acidipiscis]
MPQQGKKLGEYLYEYLENDKYLHKLMSILSKQYACWLFGFDWKLTNKQKHDLLRFADLLAKSINEKGDNRQKNIALKIIAILSKMYPDDPEVGLIANEVLTSFNNFLPRREQSYTLVPTIERLWNETLINYQKGKRQIPGEEDKSFIGKQNIIFKSLSNELTSFSAPTSMGKTFLIEKYIEFKVKSGTVGSFAITVPSKALITEVKTQLIDDLGMKLKEKTYRVIFHPDEYRSDYEGSYICVMTPERLLALLTQYSEVRLIHLFIDESQKATEASSRSTFYYEIFDKISAWESQPKVTFASPLIPNPGIFKKLVQTAEANDGLRIVESPITQVEIIFDRYANKAEVYDDLNQNTIPIGTFKETLSVPDIIRKMISILGNSNCNLVYYGSKVNAISDAVVVSRSMEESNDPRLIELADYISRKIHPKYILVKLVRKGIAFHTGELPVDVRIRIEEACRQGILKLVFCTSTLLEGVNLPADNIFVTTLQNGKRTLSQLDFLNLIGRVGRLGHSMLGNVFLITGDTENSHSNRAAYLSRMNNRLKKAKLSVDVIKPKQAAAIKKRLEKGDVRLDNIEKDKNYDLIRKLSLLYVKELRNDHHGVVRTHLAKHITYKEERKILQSLQERYADELEDDINFSSDQSESLRNKISQENIKGYPNIHDGEKLRWPEAKAFLLKLSEIFNWAIYESDFVQSNQDKETRDKIVEDDAKVILLWMSGYSLKQICDIAIRIRDPRYGDTRFLNRVSQRYNDTPNINWETITINKVMKRLQKLQFILGKYFLKVTQELTKSRIPPQNDWYRFMEYGTDSDLRIWLQQNGYSRESSEYIEDNKDEFIIQADNNYFVSKNILKANDLDAVSETKEIEINVPEIFI